MKGPQFGLWENEYNDGVAGECWQLPEFQGIFSRINWMQLELKNGASLRLETDYMNVGVLQPKNGTKPEKATWAYPASGGLYLFHVVPSIGTKFKQANSLGPQSDPVILPGKISSGVVFYSK
jgi:hypothetical protein